MIRRPPRSTLFPYTTLFRSRHGQLEARLDFSRIAVHADKRAAIECRRNELTDAVGALLIGHGNSRSEEHTSELQSQSNLVCRLLLEKKKQHEELNPERLHVR